MESQKIIVPKNLIIKYYKHPEEYGDFVVDLQNGSFTDIFFRSEGDYFTITNDNDLINYLKSFENQALEYFYINDEISFRDIRKEDDTLIQKIKDTSSLVKNYNKVKKIYNKSFIISYKWMEIGLLEFDSNLSKLSFIETDFYNHDIISQISKTIID